MLYRARHAVTLAIIGLALAEPHRAYAADADYGAKIKLLEDKIESLSQQVQELKHDEEANAANQNAQQAQSTAAGGPAEAANAPIVNTGAANPSPANTISTTAIAKDAPSGNAIVSLDNGRPTFTSADERFSAAIRGLAQLDVASYGQSKQASTLPTAYGPDLANGANFRRVWLGVQGKAFGDWSYFFNFDFGGSAGTETPGHIQSVYGQYDGFKPFAIRIGAYPPPANLEDGTPSGDTIFLERNAPSDLQRNLAGGEGRDAISILYTGDRIFGALSYTGGKAQDAAVYDEQQALLGRLSGVVYSQGNTKFVVGVNGSYIIQPPVAVPDGSPSLATTPGAAAFTSVTLSDPPELTVDSTGTKLANTGALNANHVSQWGAEAAGNWNTIYAQAGYYGFHVDRTPEAFQAFTASGVSSTAIVTPNADDFSGWYVQAAWVLTGESRTYNPAVGAFIAPRPAAPFDPANGSWGAWELAARYSDLNLNDHVLDSSNVITAWFGSNRTYTYFNTARGGDQKIWTFGLNFFPNSNFRFGLDYQLIAIGRLQTPATVTTAGTPTLPQLSASQTVHAISLRSQVSF